MINMAEIWKKKIDEIDKKIRDTEIGKDGRLMQLYECKASLSLAYIRCLRERL